MTDRYALAHPDHPGHQYIRSNAVSLKSSIGHQLEVLSGLCSDAPQREEALTEVRRRRLANDDLAPAVMVRSIRKLALNVVAPNIHPVCMPQLLIAALRVGPHDIDIEMRNTESWDDYTP